MRKDKSMSDINFEKDQEEVLDRTENIKSLANQVKKLRDLEDELKAEEEDPKKTLEEYNKLLTEKNEEFKDAIEKFVEEFEKNGITMSDIYGEKLSDTIKNLQERLKLGINKSRAGVEEEARGMRREVAMTEMTRDQHLRLL